MRVLMLYSWLVFACGNQQPTIGLQSVRQSTQSLSSGAWWAMPRRHVTPVKRRMSEADAAQQPLHHIADGLPPSTIKVESFVPQLTCEHRPGDIVFSVTC
jgi:hypothetical protein